jgi:hypothetical protein
MNGLLLSLVLLGQPNPDPGPPPPLAEVEVVHGSAIYNTPKGVPYQLTHTATVDMVKGTVVITDVQAHIATPTPTPTPTPGPVPPVPTCPCKCGHCTGAPGCPCGCATCVCTPKPAPCPCPAPVPPPQPTVVYYCPETGAGGGYGHRGHFRPVRFLLNVAFWPLWLLGRCG